MKRFTAVSLIVICLVLLILNSNADTGQLSDYDLYYPQYVDSTEPLSVLMDKDVNNWGAADISHPELSTIPSSNRKDYFNISYGNDSSQTLDIHHLNGNNPRPVIFYIHGGGWKIGSKEHSRYAAPEWVKLGYTVVSVNYRLGPQYGHPAQIDDCAKALKWVMDNIHKYGGNPNKICVTGHSAGGHLTAQLVTDEKWQKKYRIDKNKIKCWIPVSGIYDFGIKANFYHPWMQDFTNALFSGVTNLEESKKDASPINYVSGKEPPCLIIHGGDDWLVPKTNATQLYDKLRKKGVCVNMSILKGYWHCNTIVNYGDPGDQSTVIINKFLSKHLPTPLNKPCN